MGAREVVQSVIDRFTAGNYQGLREVLSEDFQFDNGRGQSMSREEWIGFLEGMRQAFPNINYNLSIVGGSGNTFTVRDQITGTHTGALDLTMLGGGVVPPTGIAAAAKAEDTVGTVVGDKVARIEIHPVDGSGLPGLLAQIGVNLPTA